MNPTKLRRWALVTLIAAGVVLGTTWLASRSVRPTFPVGNASVELLGITVGTNHRCPIGYPWERYALPLPTNLLKRLPRSEAPRPISSKVETMFVWFRCDSRLTGPDQEIRWALNDGQGTTAQAIYATVPWSAGSTVFCANFQAWPRRTARLNLEAWRLPRNHEETREPEPATLVGSISIANPRLNTTPSWAAQSLPAQDLGGDPRFNLKQFQYGWRGNVWADLETNAAVAQASVRQGIDQVTGKPNGWLLLWIRSAEDSTGNHLIPHTDWRYRKPGLMLSPAPWPGETWKLTAEFSRNDLFETNELVTLPPLVLNPAAGGLVGWHTNFNGVTLEIAGLRQYSPNSRDWDLKVRTSPYADGWNVTLAKVEGGHRLNPRGGGRLERQLNFPFQVPTNAQTATLTLAVHQSRFAEFLVRPEDVRNH